MKIYIAADHAGFELKEMLKGNLTELGHTVEDCGAHTLDAGDDYPDVVIPCAEKVAGDPGSFGVVIGASGQGEAMAANRVSGARAAVYYGDTGTAQNDEDGNELGIVESTRAHNHANILSLGARFITPQEALDAVTRFIETETSSDDRHQRRVSKLA